MTDEPVRRYIGLVHTLTSADGLIPLADVEPVGVVLNSDHDRIVAEKDAENVRLKEEVANLKLAIRQSEYRWVNEHIPLLDDRDRLAVEIARLREALKGAIGGLQFAIEDADDRGYHDLHRALTNDLLTARAALAKEGK